MIRPSIASIMFTLCMFTFIATFITSTIAAPIAMSSTKGASGLERRVLHTGRGTWFNVGQGNCGFWDTDDVPVVAISKSSYDKNGGNNCGQWVQITNVANGHTAFGITRDSCESCTEHDLDMSPSLFQKLAPLSTGLLRISWHFMSKGWRPIEGGITI